MKNAQKTDRHYEKKKVERLFLYCLGMSPNPLKISEIKDAVGKLNPPHKQNFVYEIKERLYHDSPYMPSRLLFEESNFLTKVDKEFELQPEKFRNKAFEIYKDYFKCQSCFDLEFKCIEKENQHQEKIKGILISDQQNNYLRIEINFTLLKERGKLEKGLVKFFRKSRFSDLENELYLHTGREKGRFIVRNFSIVSNYFFLDYIDMVSYQDEEKKYVLNLKGLLQLFLLSGNKLKFFEIEKIISNISKMDEYMNLRDEIDTAYGSVTSLIYIDGKPQDVKRNFASTASHRIKVRFPFLSFYDDYKDYIRSENEVFVSDFLFDVAKETEQQLRNMSIAKLKYEVTKRYLEKIRKYFYNQQNQRLLHENLSENTFDAITKLQNEMGTYIEEMKKSEYEREKLERQIYEEEQAKMRFQRRLNTLTNSDKNVISLKGILDDNGSGGIIIDASQISIIERYCKYGREEDESYSLINNYLLIKNKLLREIYENITKNNFYKDLKTHLNKNKIPLDCLHSVKVWIRDYEDSLFSERFNKWIKMVNQYPRYQTYLSTFLFEHGVFNKYFYNRLFSYFL
jgi:hypothetical protein